MRSWQPGDIVGFYGRDLTSRIIELQTWGPSHVGIVCKLRGAPVIVESTTLCPLQCEWQKKLVSGVQMHGIDERIATYPGRAEVLSLSPHWRLSAEEAKQLSDLLIHHWIGRPYDLEGAILSGTRVFKWMSFAPYPDLGSMFCSELVAAVLQRMGRMAIQNPSAYNPASLIRALLRSGVYHRVTGFCAAPELKLHAA